jgi:hypothetical protein
LLSGLAGAQDAESLSAVVSEVLAVVSFIKSG